MADVQLPDGNVARVPDFALEKTQEDMKKLLQAMVGSDKNALKVYGKLVDLAKEQTDVTESVAEEAKALQKQQLKATESIASAASKGKILGDTLFNGAMKADAMLTKSFLSLGSSVMTVVGTMFEGAQQVGNELLELQKAGVGFTDATGSAEKLIADLSYLGMTAGSAADLMKNFSGVVQVMGKTGFADIQKTFNNISDNGNKFGLSIAESAEVLGEDLERRKQLGALGAIDSQRQAQRSAELYGMQMEAAQALGQSVKEVRDKNAKLLDSNFNFQISRARTVARLGDEAGAKYLEAAEQLGTQFAGMGLADGASDAILTAMSEPAAFLAQGGSELYTALSAMGAGGKEISNEMQTIGKLMNGSAAEQEQGMAKMKEFGPMLQNNLSELLGDEKALSMFQNLVNTGSPAAGMMQSLFESAGLAKSALAGAANSAGSVQSGLAKAAQAYDAAMNTISGTMSGAMTDLSAAFAGPAGAFADALVKDTILRNKDGEILDKNGKAMMREIEVKDAATGEMKKQLVAVKDYNELSQEQKKQMSGTQSVMGAFKDAIQTIRVTILKSFGMIGGDTTNFAEIIRNKMVPAIQDFAEWFKSGGWDSIKSAFTNLKDGIIAVTAPFRVIYNLFTGDFTGAVESMGDVFGSVGAVVGGVVGSFLLVTKTLKLYNAAMALGGKAKGFLGGGATKAIGGNAPVGNAVAGKAGKGGGLGGMLMGAANGLKAIGKVPMAAIGKAALILGTITLATIGFATALNIAKDAFVPFGKMIKEILEGVAPIVSAFGDVLKSVFEGVGNALESIFSGFEGLGAGIKSILEGVGIAVEKIGGTIMGVVGGIAEGISSVINAVKGDSETSVLDAQTAAIERLSIIPADTMYGIASAIDAITFSLGYLGEISDDIDTGELEDQVNIFSRLSTLDAAGIAASAVSLGAMADVYARFANLDHAALAASADAISNINDASSPGLLSQGMSFLGFGANDEETPALEANSKKKFADQAQVEKLTAAKGTETINKTPAGQSLNAQNDANTAANNATQTQSTGNNNSGENSATTNVESIMAAIASNTAKTNKLISALNTTIENST